MGAEGDEQRGRVFPEVLGVLFLFAAVVVLFRDFALTGERIVSMPTADGWTQYFGWRYYAAEALRNWRVPLWNPYYLSGGPFMAESQTAIFYPLTLLFAVAPIGYAFNWTFILHIFMGGAFTYALLRAFGVGAIGSFVGGLAFELSSPVILHVAPGHMSNIMTISWTPLVFLCVELMVRRRSAIAALVTGLVVACQFLGGHAQYFYYSMVGAGAFFLYRAAEDSIKCRSLKVLGGHVGRYALAVGGGVALCGVQVLPMLGLVGESVRTVTGGGEWSASFSFPPENLGTLLVPDLFGDDLRFGYWGRWYSWEMIAYFGTGTLLLGMLALVLKRTGRVWFFAGLGAFSALAALGGHTPLLGVLRRVLPGFGLFRGHSKFVFLLGFCLAVLAGIGLDAVMRATGRRDVRRAWWVVGVVVSVGVVTCIVMGAEIWPGTEIWRAVVLGMTRVKRSVIAGRPAWAVGEWLQGGYWHFQRSLVLSTVFLVATAGALAVGLLRPGLRRGAGVAVAAVLLVDMWTFGWKRADGEMAPVRPWEDGNWAAVERGGAPRAFALKSCYFERELAEFFESRTEPFRVMEMGIPFTMLPSYVMEKVETIMGFSPVVSGRYQRLVNYVDGWHPEDMSGGVVPMKAGRLFSLLNMRYVIVPAYWESLNEKEYCGVRLAQWAQAGIITKERYDRVPRIEGGVVFESRGLRVFENKEAVPRAYVVHSYEVVNGDDAILERLNSPDFDARRTVILEEEPEGFEALGGGTTDEWVRITSYEPERVEVEATLGSPGFLVLADMYYPGWQAEVDGKRAGILRANYLVRAVGLGEGEHAVVFRYEPLPYRVGRGISLGVLCGFVAGFAGLGFWRGKRK